MAASDERGDLEPAQDESDEHAPDQRAADQDALDPDASGPDTQDGGDSDIDAPQVEGEDVAEGLADEDEPVVVTTEVQPETDEVVDVEPEGEPEPEMLHGVLFGYSRGQVVLHPTREEYPELVRRLRDAGFLACVDLTAVDYLGFAAGRDLPARLQPERFEVVVILLNHAERERVRVRVQVPASDARLESIVGLHPGAENPEREVYDMYGITFEGHPDLTRILMPDEWEGHPLRKDAHSGRIPVQFKGTASGH